MGVEILGFLDNLKEAYEEGKEKGRKEGSFEYQVDKLKKESEDKTKVKQEEKEYQKNRLDQLNRDKVPYCPKCKSTSVTFVNKKLSIGRAITGGIIAGETGAKLGGFTSKKGKVKCLNCGNDWKI